MKRRARRGFSLLEVIAAVIILAVVAAATVATVAPMKEKSEANLDKQQVASLSAMAQTFQLEHDRFPYNARELGTRGYLPYNTPEERQRVNQMVRKYNYTRNTGTFTVKE